MDLYDETQIDDETAEGESEESTESGTEDSVSDRIKQLEENQALTQVLADPDVQKVLSMKKDGKRIDVKELAKAEETADPDLEIKDDDPAAELLRKISGIMDKKLNPIAGRVDAIERVAQQVQSKEVNGQIAKVKEKHPDMDKYKEKMILLSQENPGLNVEELYIMARMRAGKLELDEPSTFSEKPTTQPRRPMGLKDRPTPRGRQGFNQVVQEALSKLDLDSLE
jgi:hypothetical protein